MGMFDFFLMADNYEDRVVANFTDGVLTVDTTYVNDGAHPYETGIEHPQYNEGDWVIVEAYDTKEDAQAGHDKWVVTMTADDLPPLLTDCANAEIGQLYGAMGGALEFPRDMRGN